MRGKLPAILLLLYAGSLFAGQFEEDCGCLEENNGEQGVLIGDPGRPDWYPDDGFSELYDSLTRLDGENVRPEGWRSAVLSTECVSAYRKLFARDTLIFDIFYGYSNFKKDIVFDRYQALVLIEHLMEPCVAGYYACGFSEEDGDSETLSKKISGPDGRIKTIKITVRSSSVSDRNSKNVSELRSQQKKRTKEILAEFEKSLRNSDIVFYKGHSRRGCGPGFEPWPGKYLADHIRIRFLKIPLRRMENALRSGSRVQLFGHFGCKSKDHYAEVLRRVSPAVALILSETGVKFLESNQSVVAAIDSILGMKCESDFKKGLNVYRRNQLERFKNDIIENLKIYGFFEKNIPGIHMHYADNAGVDYQDGP